MKEQDQTGRPADRRVARGSGPSRDAAEAEAMEAREIRALRRLGIADPYAGSVPVAEGAGR